MYIHVCVCVHIYLFVIFNMKLNSIQINIIFSQHNIKELVLLKWMNTKDDFILLYRQTILYFFSFKTEYKIFCSYDKKNCMYFMRKRPKSKLN